jgi:hypothetical protein
MKIIKGLWYQCGKSHSYFTEGNWYYSPEDNYLNGDNDKPSYVYGFRQKYFTDVQEIRIKEIR